MSFIEKQRHGDHDYYYLVKTIRVTPARVRKLRVFLGRSVPEKEVLQERLKELESKVPPSYVSSLIPKTLVERLEDLRATIAVLKAQGTEILPKDFLVRFTYNTNAIEGSKLTLRQTALLLIDNVVPQGANTENVIEALNSRDAWEFVRSSKGPLSSPFVRRIQRLLTMNTSCRMQGKFRLGEVRISGSTWIPPPFTVVPGQMDELLAETRANRKRTHPLELATRLHNRLVQIHPFTDGNGRTARLLANWVLLQNKFPPLIVEAHDREEYYRAIESADAGSDEPMAKFLAMQLLKQYTLTVKSSEGEE